MVDRYHRIHRRKEITGKILRTDHIDLYQMHHIERTTPWEEIWQAMEQLVREGKVIYYLGVQYDITEQIRTSGEEHAIRFG